MSDAASKPHLLDCLARLQSGHLRTQQLGPTLNDALTACAQEEEPWQGLAFTTAGARVVTSVDGQALCCRSISAAAQPSQIDQATVYELRLWRVGVPQHCATEVRWLNGWGAVRVDVSPAGDDTVQADDGPSCLLRENNYLQHGEGAAQMHTVEVFTTDNYGNVSFTDELFCGEWSTK